MLSDCAVAALNRLDTDNEHVRCTKKHTSFGALYMALNLWRFPRPTF
jgi:hypothetical protein